MDIVCAKVDQTIEGDARRIRQVIINLLSNAIKYTNTNDIILLSVEEKEHCVCITVQDHGPGIAETEIEKLFQDYYRIQNHYSSQKEGLGLGLALCKNSVELHNGSINVESSQENGTQFKITLPLKHLVINLRQQETELFQSKLRLI